MQKRAMQLFLGLLLFSVSVLWAEEVVRKEVYVPKVDPAAIVIDSQLGLGRGAARAQVRPDPGERDREVDRLRDVVVGAE